METEIKLKQYVIVPKKPRMSKGKIASQVAHATFMALEKQSKIIEDYAPQGFDDKFVDCDELCVDDGDENEPKSKWDNIKEWKNNGMCVIVLQCKNSLELFGIAKYLDQWKIPHHLYIDEGITEVNMGTPTALATGVLPEDKHWILGTMKLFK